MQTRRAFTLVELLMVIAIITILAAMLLPTFESALEESRRVVCLNTLHQQHVAAINYAQEWQGRLPRYGRNSWDPAIYSNQNMFKADTNYGPMGWGIFLNLGYMTKDLFRCPSMDFDPYQPPANSMGMHYCYRFNSLRGAYSTYYNIVPNHSSTLGDYPAVIRWLDSPIIEQALYQKRILFYDNGYYTFLGGATSGTPYTASTGWNQIRWAHQEGGNLVTICGAARYAENTRRSTNPAQWVWPGMALNFETTLIANGDW